MATGNGAFVIHRELERAIEGYEVIPYNPWLTLFPPTLWAFRSRSADLIHTTPDYATFFTQRDKPLVITFHNYVLDDFMQRYSSPLQRLHYHTDLYWFTRMAVNRADAITAVSHFTADLVKRDIAPHKPIFVIPNGIDTKRFQPPVTRASHKIVQVLFSGNLSIRKGTQLLPLIANRVSPNVKIVVASGLRSGSGLEHVSNIDTIGRIPYPQMPKLYQDVDILLMPTVREGMSLAVLEAMASGLPVVATDCSSMPELITHGKGGFLCRLGDADDFARHVNTLASDPELRREMGEYNRARVETRHQLHTMTGQYFRLFRQLLEH
jgi:glycosyltransferase involved in cell wall biosynthesis